ncbi:uncharacterized protein [Penaeus vannamei]|uniref:uncharacterized protein n=1 Tax=Penaeus vannamei TaxID=6689 RepID=UPI00387F6A5A
MNIASYEQVKDWDIRVEDESGLILERNITRGSADQHVVHSNYVLGKTYTFLFFPVLKEPDGDCKIRFTKNIFFNETTDTFKQENPPDRSRQLKISLAVASLCVALLLSRFVWKRSRRVRRRPNLEAQAEVAPSLDVLLVHTNESLGLRARIRDLTGTLQKNGKKVFDIFSERDPTVRQDPQAWLFGKILSNAWVVFVLTRKMGELYDHLDAHPEFVEPHEILRRTPHAYDGNLVTVLRFFLDQQDDSRWLTVRFDELEAEDSIVGSGPRFLTGGRLFLLPAHEEELLQTLDA